MDTKVNPYLSKIMILCSVLVFLLLIIDHIYHLEWLFYIVMVFIFLMMFIYILEHRNQKRYFHYLTLQCESIIEGKEMLPIDGESEISVLSSQLHILSMRYDTLLETMQLEQMKLKDYIENISHQLKTPMTSMRLNEELLMEQLDGKYAKKVQHIYQQTLKIETLVNDLLTLALLDSHSIAFHFETEDIVMMFEDIESDLDYLLTQNHVNMILHSQVPTMICDYKWMKEALINILKNCVENTQNQKIDIEIIEFDMLIQIKIHDHGTGFSQEDLLHLFERFYHGQKKAKGIGIGLAIVKEIVEAHHGQIHVYNDEGAVFEICIPKIFAKKKVKVTGI